ncbi:uncharacterized protein LOC143570519 [Bidens hawaiensis]|uniref:uncharacterized protein LOC143570519 n=1 Tax=Bidens hawaiensis TaxID=980011 RepID=UPI00404AAC90
MDDHEVNMDDHEVDMSVYNDLRVEETSTVQQDEVLDNDLILSGPDSDDNETSNRKHQLHAVRNANENRNSEDQVHTNPDILVKSVQEQFQRKYELGVSRLKAYRARAKAKKMVQEDYISQYAILRDYVLELKKQNPGTTVKIQVEEDTDASLPTRRFRRMYVCFGALKQGFKAIGRDLLGLDGAFMKGPFPGQILSVVGVDPNNGIYPLAIAIVETQALLSSVIGKRYYVRHIHENFKATFRGKLYKDLLYKCAHATKIPEFEAGMEELKAFNKEAHQWLSKSHFTGRALSDVLLNNMCEVFNGNIVEGRDKPIISAIDYIREYLMRRITNVLAVTNKTDSLLTPKATKEFDIIRKNASHYNVQWNGGICIMLVVDQVFLVNMWWQQFGTRLHMVKGLVL